MRTIDQQESKKILSLSRLVPLLSTTIRLHLQDMTNKRYIDEMLKALDEVKSASSGINPRIITD